MIPPSLLARKMLCSAYTPKPFNRNERLMFLGFHARVALRVIRRHIGNDYSLSAVELFANGCRIDLLFRKVISNVRRLCEVKTARTIKEVYRIQTALYLPYCHADELCVSNGTTDELLTPAYIQEILKRKEATIGFLTNYPRSAAGAFTPHPDASETCNTSCPYLPKGGDCN